jgi:hypothetical protein
MEIYEKKWYFGVVEVVFLANVAHMEQKMHDIDCRAFRCG